MNNFEVEKLKEVYYQRVLDPYKIKLMVFNKDGKIFTC